MTSFSDLPLDAQYASAVALFNRTSNSWSALDHLASLSNHATVDGHVDQVVDMPQPMAIDAGQTDAQHPQHYRQGAEAYAAVRAVLNNMRDVSLISSNEHLDEIATPHLKYLLLPYLCAAAQEAIQGAREQRLSVLQAALSDLRQFFQSMDRLSLLSPSDRSYVLDDGDDRDDSDVRAGRYASSAATRGRAETRQEKIERFRAEKEAERKLNILVQRMDNNRKAKSGASNGHADDDDEEIERQICLVMLQSGLRKALDLFTSVQRELPMLTWAQRQHERGIDPAEEARRRRAQAPVQPIVPGMPPTFRIVNERQREQEAMFRPSHNLPTYSIEQWGEIQAREMQKKQEREQEGIRAKRSEQDDEDEDRDEVADKKTSEARRWDDWKDEHNRGSGNTIR